MASPLFSAYLFERLSINAPYFLEKDSYKDEDGKGLLERFLQATGEEWDNYLMPSIEGLLDTLQLLTTAPKFISHFAEILGNPPDIAQDLEIYRRLLMALPTINKFKGTIKSYELLFAILDPSITITITEYSPVTLKYDEGYKYDEVEHDTQAVRYDSACPPCSDYSLAISDPDSAAPYLVPSTMTEEQYLLFRKFIEYVEPINAVLRSVTYNGDPLPEKSWVLNTCYWDDNAYWDDDRYWMDSCEAMGSITVKKQLIINPGDALGGGYVFYIDPTGSYALVADLLFEQNPAKDDYATGIHCFIRIGSNYTDVGEGILNQEKVLKTITKNDTFFNEVSDSMAGGFNDWYVPCNDEVSLIIAGLAELLPEYTLLNSSTEYDHEPQYYHWVFDYALGQLSPVGAKDDGQYQITIPIRKVSLNDLSFGITLTGPNDYEETATISPTTPAVFDNLTYGEYIVVEDSTPLGEFTIHSYVPDDTVTVDDAHKDKEITLINLYTPIPS